jgi:thiamine kinase-like enzyme
MSANELIKWVSVSHDARTRVSKRLDLLLHTRVPHTSVLLHYGWCPNAYSRFNQTRVRLCTELVSGTPLYRWALNASQTQRRELQEILSITLCAWREYGFVHGDLSPRNLFISNTNKLTVFAIDWMIDLKSFAGTPAYTCMSALSSGKTFETDETAITRIVAKFLSSEQN